MRGYGRILTGGGGEIQAPTITMDAPFTVSEGDVFFGQRQTSGYTQTGTVAPRASQPGFAFSRNYFVHTSAIYSYPGLQLLNNGISTAQSISISEDESIIASVFVTNSVINTNRWDGSSLTRIQIDNVAGLGRKVVISGNRLVASHTSSPFISMFEYNGTSFTRVFASISFPAIPYDFDFNGQFLVMVSRDSPYMKVYRWDNNAYVQVPDMVGAAADYVSIYNDRFVTLGTSGLILYTWNGYNFTGTQITNTPGALGSLDISPDGNELMYTTSISPYLYRYTWDGTTYVRNEAISVSGQGIVQYNPNGDFVFRSTPYTGYTFYTPNRQIIYSRDVLPNNTTFGNIYVARQDAASGESLRTYEIPAIR